MKEARGLLMQFRLSLYMAESSLAFRKRALLVEEEPLVKHVTENEHFAERTIFRIFNCKRVFTGTNDLARLHHLVCKLFFCNNGAK